MPNRRQQFKINIGFVGRNLLLFFAMVSNQSQAADWPQFKMDAQRTGNAETEKIKLPLNLNTALSLGAPIMSSPSVIDDKVYVQTENGQVYCIDGPTNKILWKTDIGGHGKEKQKISAHEPYIYFKLLTPIWHEGAFCFSLKINFGQNL